MEDKYRMLALRNGWNYSVIDNRPYFMKDGNYAIPDDTTTTEDKELLAEIISEGSDEMKKLILMCWENGIGISGPCSGISEYHNNPPHSLHFSFISNKELIDELCNNLKTSFPTFTHRLREQMDNIRYDIDYILNGNGLTTDESNQIFAIIRKQLEYELEKSNQKKH